MAKNIELLLTSTVENLGIIGDIVKVKKGYARNYLVPMGMAIKPIPSRIESLKEARAQAQKELSLLREAREELLTRMGEVTIEMERSCDDQGALYGSVTQRDISDALQGAGYDVGVRSVRMAGPLRRVGTYEVPIQFEKDLRTDVNVIVKPDRLLEEEEKAEAQQQDAEERPRRREPESPIDWLND